MPEAIVKRAVSLDHVCACLHAACLLEATARKPGNVHPQASFPDLTYAHFQKAAERMPILATAGHGIGKSIYDAIQATRRISPSNANLGIVLLLAPLAAVPRHVSLKNGIGPVLDQLTIEDADWVYRAIRLARPGGMGQVTEQDIADTPTGTLLGVMQSAADRDRIALQYANRFFDVLDFGLSCLASEKNFARDWESVIIRLQLKLLERSPDTLILRKCGPETADEASRRARNVLAAGPLETPAATDALAEFDRWLRSDGNRRNPGTTADLIAACLFAALRDEILPIPEWCRLNQSQEKNGS